MRGNRGDACADLGCGFDWTLALTVELLVVELLGELTVQFPPLAQRFGVVGAGGANAALGVPIDVAEVILGILRHTLYLQRKNL